MTDPLCHTGHAEVYKGGIHLVMFGLSSTCAAYNLMAATERPTERHLWVNSVLYIGLASYEFRQLLRHLGAT